MSDSKPVIASVDMVIYNEKDEILLIKRGNDPYKGMWAFPGGRIDGTDKDILSAAYRELKEETNILDVDVTLSYVTTIGNNTRDPRGFCLSNIFVGYCPTQTIIKAGDDATEYGWFRYNELPPMAFDHNEIMTKYFSPTNWNN